LTLPSIPDTVAFVSSKPSEPAHPASDTPAGSIRVQLHVSADRVVRLPLEIPEGPAELIVIPRAAASAEARRAAFGRFDHSGFVVPGDFHAPLTDHMLGRSVEHDAEAPKSQPVAERSTRGTLSLHPPGLFPVLLSRLFDDEVAALGPWCHAIETERFADFSRSMTQRQMTLPRIFLAARHIFGRSSTCFDPHKGSFAFPVLLSAMRDASELRYVLVLHDLRGTARVAFHHFNEQRNQHDSSSPAGELSQREIGLVIDALLEFLYLCGDAAARGVAAVHRTVPSELTVYGCRNGDLFESSFESAEEYQRAVERICGDLAEVELVDELEYVSQLLRDVMGDGPKRA
jgi:hypothetical protein